ncbi:MAG: metallophosphoesterase [Bacteroidales bacterium]|nr:metallophosphoesterase [Bacteroidales bacterium]
MVIFQIIIFLSFILGSGIYISVRLWQIAPFGQLGKIIFIALIIFLFLAFILSFIIGNVLPVSITKILYRVGSAWFFICVYLLIIFLLIDIIRLTHLVNIDQYIFNNKYFFMSLCLFLTVLMSSGYIKYQNKTREEININFSQSNLNKNLKLVTISDLHLGYGIGNKELNRWIKLINKENADIVLIVGDMIDNSIKPVLRENMAENLKKIKSKFGVYSVLGNHEYISGIDACINFIKSADITLLRDSSVMINDLYIIGRDDQTNKSRKTLNELIDGLDTTKPIILLDHQPTDLNDAMNKNVDLQISGHTHRGQIWPISWVTDKIFEVSHGYYQKNNTHYYISSGIGIWGGKFRIGSQSEYIVINFKY